jgi:hypothetical protein
MDDRATTIFVELIKTLVEESTVLLGELGGLRPHEFATENGLADTVVVLVGGQLGKHK